MWFSRSRKLGPVNYSMASLLLSRVASQLFFVSWHNFTSPGVSVLGFDVETAPLRTRLLSQCLRTDESHPQASRPHAIGSVFPTGRVYLVSSSPWEIWARYSSIYSIQGTAEPRASLELATQTQGEEPTYVRGDRCYKLSSANKPLNMNGDCFLFNSFALS